MGSSMSEVSRRQALRLLVGGATASLLAVGFSAHPTATPVEAASWCWCTDYVKARFGLTGASGNAKDMGPYLISKGFRQITWPQPGAVIIFQPEFGSSIASQGHVGVINYNWKSNNNQNWNVNVRGANQVSGGFTDAGCSNVTDVTFKSYPWWSNAVTYYLR